MSILKKDYKKLSLESFQNNIKELYSSLGRINDKNRQSMLLDYVQFRLKKDEKSIKENMFKHNSKIQILKKLRREHYEKYFDEIDSILFSK